MSADACVVFFGIRFEVAEDKIEALELRTDPRMLAARKAGLQHYWANFAAPQERYFLLVGAKLGILGPEDSAEVVVRTPQLQAVMDSTRMKLEAAGLAGEPALHIQWRADA